MRRHKQRIHKPTEKSRTAAPVTTCTVPGRVLARTLRDRLGHDRTTGAFRGALALLYRLGSSSRQGSMHAAATNPVMTRPCVSLGRRPSSRAVTHMEVRARHASTCTHHRGRSNHMRARRRPAGPMTSRRLVTGMCTVTVETVGCGMGRPICWTALLALLVRASCTALGVPIATTPT